MRAMSGSNSSASCGAGMSRGSDGSRFRGGPAHAEGAISVPVDGNRGERTPSAPRTWGWADLAGGRAPAPFRPPSRAPADRPGHPGSKQRQDRTDLELVSMLQLLEANI